MSKAEHLLRKRNRRETRFRIYGLASILLVLTVLGMMLLGILVRSASVFEKSFIHIQINSHLHGTNLDQHDYRDVIYQALLAGGGLEGMSRRDVLQLISPGAEIILQEELKKAMPASSANPHSSSGKYRVWLLASDEVDYYVKHSYIRDLPENQRRLNDAQLDYLNDLKEKGLLKRKFNWLFFTNGDSRAPEVAGIKSALAGSLWTILVTLLLALPLGIAAAVYIEEFAPRNRLVRFLELNINNLASVPSIVYGLLGLMVFINVMHLPRGSPLVGGMTLALMIMPTIFIASRTALQTVPKAIARAAEALGASRIQVVFHHKVPLALPGILTGTILGIARALGESAALLMIGMVAFVVDVPKSPQDPATVLPVQIFSWSRNPEVGFEDHTAAAIMVLLLLLMVINMSAIYIRKKFEHRW